MRLSAAALGFLYVTSLSFAGESLFDLLAEAGAPVGLVEAPGTVFAKRPGLARMLLEAGVWENDGAQSRPAEMDPRIVRLMMRASVDPNARIHGGGTPIMQAAREGLAEAVELLLDKGADVNLRDDQGRTALMHAAAGGDPEVVALLIACGADVHAKDARGSTARDRVRKKHPLALELLVSGLSSHRE